MALAVVTAETLALASAIAMAVVVVTVIEAEFVAAAVVVAAGVAEVDTRPAFSISNHSNKKCRATLGLLEYVGNFGHLAISKGLAF